MSEAVANEGCTCSLCNQVDMAKAVRVLGNGALPPDDQHNVETFGPIESGRWGQVDTGLTDWAGLCKGTSLRYSTTKNDEGLLPRDPIPTQILDEARKVVYGRGESEYGHPRDDFSRTAGMLTALFADKLRPGTRFDPEDVAKAMICVKLSRSRTDEKADNYVDIAGYAETAARVLWDAKPDG